MFEELWVWLFFFFLTEKSNSHSVFCEQKLQHFQEIKKESGEHTRFLLHLLGSRKKVREPQKSGEWKKKIGLKDRYMMTVSHKNLLPKNLGVLYNGIISKGWAVPF